MKTHTTIQSLQSTIDSWQSQGQSIAFVPTMGGLHDGHLALVEFAKQKADKVVVSIFVNPTQFGENEDFGQYPNTFEQDNVLLEQHQVDGLFIPSIEQDLMHQPAECLPHAIRPWHAQDVLRTQNLSPHLHWHLQSSLEYRP